MNKEKKKKKKPTRKLFLGIINLPLNKSTCLLMISGIYKFHGFIKLFIKIGNLEWHLQNVGMMCAGLKRKEKKKKTKRKEQKHAYFGINDKWTCENS